MPVSSSSAKSIAILGAGVTGLSTAYRLARRGHQVRLFEASGRVGGAIRTEIVDDWLIEGGPNTLLAGDSAFTSLIDELGLGHECISARAAAKKRYIVRGGRPIAAPMSPPALLVTSLFSLSTRARILGEILFRPRQREGDVSLAQFIRDHFGQEVVDYGLNPFVGGVYAGDPQRLSTRHAFPALWEIERTHGSIVRGQITAARTQRRPAPARRRGIVSFRRGLQTLPAALAAQLPAGSLTRPAKIETLLPGPPWTVVWRHGSAVYRESFGLVVAALPAPALAALRFGVHEEQPLAALDLIEHPPVTSVFLGYRRDQVSHPLDGFGVLVPECERRSVLGILFSSSLFPGRAPADHVALTVIVGGTRQPALARMSPPDILAAIEPDLKTLLGVHGAPVISRQTHWPRAIPQYDLGYGGFLETMAVVERRFSGFLVGGQARDGISLPACLAAGEKLATRATAEMSPDPQVPLA